MLCSMEKHANLKSLKVSLILLFCFWQLASTGQSIFYDTLDVGSEITAFSQDRAGNFFLALKGGSITKYNNKQDSLISYSPSKLGDITLIEAWHGFKIFTFYQEFQDFTILDRYLSRDIRYALSQSSQNYVDMCTYTRDQNLWVYEENQLRLLKINLNLREIEIDVPLEFIISSQDHRITFMKEYQNLVFLVDELSGIYIFDNLGNYLRKISSIGIQHCSFKKDRIYYITNNQIHVVGLYKEEHQVIDLPADKYLGIIASNSSLLLVTKTKIFGMDAN